MNTSWNDLTIPYAFRAQAAEERNQRLSELAQASRIEAGRMRERGDDTKAEQCEEDARAFDALRVDPARSALDEECP